MRKREHQSGFGSLVIVLVLAVVAVLAIGGVVAYQHHKGTSAKDSAATSSSQTTTQPKNTTSTQPQPTTYLSIKEWGVQIALDSTTASLYYYINPQLPDIAYLSLKSISDVAPTCAANNGPLGAISRLTPAEHQSALSGSIHSIPGTIQIGNYWYGYEGSHADCTDGTAAMHAAISKAAPNFNASTLINTFTTLASTPSAN